MIDPRCSLDVRESGARLGFVHESTMGVDELLVKLKCRIPFVRKTVRPFCKGGFSLRDALYFYVVTIEKYCIVSRCFYSTPTVVAQYLPLAFVAQQMVRLMG